MMLRKESLERYMRIVRPNLDGGAWFVQIDHGNGFSARRGAGTPRHVERMLMGEYWIASRARSDGTIDWFGVDLDGTTTEENDPVALYRDIRRLVGVERRPLVYRTPSGTGLRVYWRIPRTPIECVITALEKGLFADVLRGAGLPLGKGTIEIFPQRKQSDRLMLGRRMPLLDPDTLEVLPHAAIGDRWDPVAFEGALAVVEEWYARPHEDLLAHLDGLFKLKYLAPVRDADKVSTDYGNEILFVRERSGDIRPSGEMMRLVEGGLPGPSSRFEAEFHVALAMALRPEDFSKYGMRWPFHASALGLAVARWLAEHHNGYSDEWNESVRRERSVEGAIRHWAARYLDRSKSTGDHMVDRVMRALRRVHPPSTPVRQLAPSEVDHILAISERHYAPGPARYRFEVWAHTCLAAVREILHYHMGLADHGVVQPGQERYRILSDETSGEAVGVEVEIAAAWMKHWPYGAGGKRSPTAYLEFRSVLEAEGLITLATEYSYHGPDAEGLGVNRARRYRLPAPAPTVLRDLPVAPWVLRAALQAIESEGEGRLHIAEAYHLLHLTRRGTDLRARYGKSRARWIADWAGRLEARLAGPAPAALVAQSQSKAA